MAIHFQNETFDQYVRRLAHCDPQDIATNFVPELLTHLQASYDLAQSTIEGYGNASDQAISRYIQTATQLENAILL